MRVRLVATAAVLITGVSAPSALGAAVTSDRPCYREGDTATFTGTGFQPGQPVAVSIDGQQLDSAPAGAAGQLVAPIRLGTIVGSQQARTLSMTQTTNPPLTATRTFLETEHYVVAKSTAPIRRRKGRFMPSRPLRIRAAGFYGAGPTLYAHVRGPRRRNIRIGRIRGACGKVKLTRKRLFKRGDPAGIYLIQYDTARRFGGLRAPFVGDCAVAPAGPFCISGYSLTRLFFRPSRASATGFRTPDVFLG